MRRGKVKVIATLIPIPGSMEQEAGQRVKTLDSLRRIAARGGIKNIPDPALFCQLTEGKSLSAPALVDEAQGAVRERDSFGSESGSL
jgi:hypothetical protein